MNNFEYWKNKFADIPDKKDDGYWYDLETGHQYDASIDYEALENGTASIRQKVNTKCLENRKTAKKFGGLALRGTLKQKEWAEKIRACILTSVSKEVAEILATSKNYSHSRFWIVNKDKSLQDFEMFIYRKRELVNIYNALLDSKDDCSGEIKQIAEKHNALTALWGFDY